MRKRIAAFVPLSPPATADISGEATACIDTPIDRFGASIGWVAAGCPVSSAAPAGGGNAQIAAGRGDGTATTGSTSATPRTARNPAMRSSGSIDPSAPCSINENLMKSKLTLALGALAMTALAGCDETASSTGSDFSSLTPGQAACVRDVGALTESSDVVIQRSMGAQSGVMVDLLVNGSATFTCTAYGDGTTDIQSTTDEGFL